MITSEHKHIINEISDSIEVSTSAYETAAKRYDDIGRWFKDKSKSISSKYSPHIFPQGSFRLGTTIKPWGREDFDLDLACKLASDLDQNNITQKQLKELVGKDLENYRKERKIQETIENKHRCWRLNYQDQINFHIDSVPCIPANENQRSTLKEGMIKAGSTANLAENVTKLAVYITDDRKPSFPLKSTDWNLSNPEGYALWFEEQMRKASLLMESRAKQANFSKVDDLPIYKWKSPLQQCVQVLKRHRDIMFEKNPDAKPISVIITTLAARAYEGETNISNALRNILSKMENLISPTEPRIPNPVNLKEDFSDRWATQEGRKLKLEDNFRAWLKDAQETFKFFESETDIHLIEKRASISFGSSIKRTAIIEQSKRNGLIKKAAHIGAGASTSTTRIIGNAGIVNKPHEFYGDEME